MPTAVFGLLCLGSLWARRPLIYRFAIEFIGPDTPKGREFESLWQYHGFRHAFRLLHRGLGRRVPGRGGGPGHHRRDDLDRHRADRLQGHALRRRRRPRRLDDRATAATPGGKASGSPPKPRPKPSAAAGPSRRRPSTPERRRPRRTSSGSRTELGPNPLGVVRPVVRRQHVVAEIVRRVPPRRMDVGAVSPACCRAR